MIISMKKFFAIVTAMLVGSCGVAMAQEVNVATDSVASVQDSVAVVQEAPAEVQRVAKVEVVEEEENLFDGQKKDYGASIAKTWEYRVYGTGNTSSGTSSITSDESAGLDFGIGYNVTSWLYTGISTGIVHDFGGTSSMSAGDVIPWLANIQLRWNVKRKLSLFVEGRAGVFCNVTPDKKDVLNNNKEKVDFEYPNYMYYDIQPGLLFRITEKFDLRLSFGYGYAKVGKETKGFEGRTYDETILTGKFGIGYRFR